MTQIRDDSTFTSNGVKKSWSILIIISLHLKLLNFNFFWKFSNNEFLNDLNFFLLVELLDNQASTDVPSSPTPKSFLSKLTIRKPSILSLSSASSPGSASPNFRRAASPLQDDEKRKILKMLISPSSERKPSKDINEFMMIANQTIKAAKSAENLSTNNQVCIN